MFALPTGNDNEGRGEGSSLEFPILLDGVAEDQFRAFLSVLYPLWVAIHHLKNVLTHPRSAGGPPVTGFEDWIGVLHLATMWEFKLVSSKKLPFLNRTNAFLSS